jgi:hypothetical protein
MSSYQSEKRPLVAPPPSVSTSHDLDREYLSLSMDMPSVCVKCALLMAKLLLSFNAALRAHSALPA